MTLLEARCSRMVAWIAAILLVGLTGCSSAENGAETKVAAMSAIAQAEIAFVGGHSQAEIKARMDEALNLYGLPTTEDNYSRAGSTLVALQKENGTPEMMILDHMIRSHVPGVKMSFPEAAAISSVFLKAGDR